jgi:3-hydroxybutyryl-CoA dehydrogenase
MIQAQEIRTVAVIGAGVMGSGIAQTFAQAGCAVRLQARRDATLQAALDRIAKNQAAMDLACALARRIGRIPIRIERDVPGFLWNRLQLALVREALHVVAEGLAGPEAVDQAVTAGLGLRWTAVGPFRLMDLGGLATFHAIAAYLYRDLSIAQAPQPILGDKVAKGETGLRAGRGFYDYPPGQTDAAIAARDARLFALLKLLGTPASREPEQPGA